MVGVVLCVSRLGDGTGGLQHEDIHAVGLLGPPCAHWLVLGAVVHRWLLSLRPPWSVFASGGRVGGLGRRVCCLSGLVAVLGLYWGGGFSAFIL